MTMDIGIQYNPFDPEFQKDPYTFYAQARREAPVCYSPIIDMWLVTRYDDVLTVLKDPIRFSSGQNVGPPPQWPPEVLAVLEQDGFAFVPVLFNSDPPIHTRIHSLFAAALTPARIAAMEPKIRTLAHGLIDEFAQDGQADLVARYTYPLPMMVPLEMIGVPSSDRARVKEWNDAWHSLTWDTMNMTLEEQIAAVRKLVEYQHYYAAMIEDRQAHPRDDLVTALVQARVEGMPPLTREEMVWQLMGLLIAAHETTLNGFANILLRLLRDPARLQALQTDPHAIPAAIEEGLRLDPPVQGLPRIVTQDTELGGVPLPAGTQLMVMYASANHDALELEVASRSNNHRSEPIQHMAFGWGTHYCLGARLARLEMRVATEALLARLPNLRLEPGFEPEYVPHFFLHGPARLPVTWEVDR